MRWQDYVSLLPPDELIGKVVDPKMIVKIIANNRARKSVDKQKILADTLMDIAQSLKKINYEDYVSIFPPEELYGKVVDPKIIEKIIAKNRARKAIDNQKILVNHHVYLSNAFRFTILIKNIVVKKRLCPVYPGTFTRFLMTFF